MVRTRPVLALVALLVLAPILAAVIICILLLFGVDPHLVFLPGHFVRSRLEAFGVPTPNRVGVLSTVVFWWGIILVVWVALRRWTHRGREQTPGGREWTARGADSTLEDS